MLRQVVAAAALIFAAPLALAADPAPKPGAQPTRPDSWKRGSGRPLEKKFVAMDMGPYLATTAALAKDNTIYKGILIPLNKEKTIAYCFDTEMLRAAAWTGGLLHWESRAFVDDSNDFSFVDGDFVFKTNVTPGWTATDQRDDPRQPTEPKRGPQRDGPLPRSWGRYDGLYVHGDRVVIAYTVGDAKVLETPGLVVKDDVSVITRTFHVGPTKSPLTILVREEPRVAADGVEPAAAAASHANRLLASLPGAEWNIQGDRTYLKLPPGDRPRSFTVAMTRGGTDEAKFDDALKAVPPAEDLAALTKGGPARFAETVATQGALGTNGSPDANPKDKKPAPPVGSDAPYVVDVLTAPETNPYKSWIRFTGFDFFPDGKSAALCTWNGDVWVVNGIDDKLDKLVWRRYATGLHQPMGLKIIDGKVHTTCRDQITRLTDLNGDGEADFYENFNNDCPLTTNFHEFDFDLQTDAAGNLYYAKGSSIWAGEQRPHAFSGSVVKVSPDGSKSEVLCHGLRAPNGIAVSPQGWITAADNQGNWTPECCIDLIEAGKFYGYVHPGYPPQDRVPPLVWIPMRIDNSTAGQTWVPGGDARWGPFAGQMIAVSYGGGMSRVLLEPDPAAGGARSADAGVPVQGGVIKFNDLRFPTGLMRPRFNPADGQLYVCGLRGWSSGAPREQQFARVRYTGKPVRTILSARTTAAGMDLTFTCPLDPASVLPDNVAAEQFNVVRTQGYGSGEFSVAEPKKKGHDPVEITAAKLSPDGRTVSLAIPALRPVTNFVLKFNVRSADGAAVTPELNYTINRVAK
jgi:hypothetical protein